MSRNVPQVSFIPVYVWLFAGLGGILLLFAVAFVIRRRQFYKRFGETLQGRRPGFHEIIDGVPRDTEAERLRNPHNSGFIRGSRTKVGSIDISAFASDPAVASRLHSESLTQSHDSTASSTRSSLASVRNGASVDRNLTTMTMINLTDGNV